MHSDGRELNVSCARCTLPEGTIGRCEHFISVAAAGKPQAGSRGTPKTRRSRPSPATRIRRVITCVGVRSGARWGLKMKQKQKNGWTSMNGRTQPRPQLEANMGAMGQGAQAPSRQHVSAWDLGRSFMNGGDSTLPLSVRRSLSTIQYPDSEAISMSSARPRHRRARRRRRPFDWRPGLGQWPGRGKSTLRLLRLKISGH
jgi:hypothetical protein